MKNENYDLLVDKETALEHIGNKIYEERTKQKITLTSLANRTMLSEGYIRSIEKGRYACSVINFLKICNALKINFNEVLNENDNIEGKKILDNKEKEDFQNDSKEKEESKKILEKSKIEEKIASNENEKINRINNKILENILNQNKNIKICALKYMKEKI